MILLTATALTACGGHQRETVADTTTLHACEIRQTQFGDVAATVTANFDASLAGVDVSGGSQSERRAALRSAYRAFGQPRADTIVHPMQSKWGLNAWVDRCGHAVTPRAR
ncbi:MAG TPA: hypothetical protein VGK84_00410 [Candidatus Tumulicola sp.]|jgi:hypothetical protein